MPFSEFFFRSDSGVFRVGPGRAGVDGFPDSGNPIVSGRRLHDLDVEGFRFLLRRSGNQVQRLRAPARLLARYQRSYGQDAGL